MAARLGRKGNVDKDADPWETVTLARERFPRLVMYPMTGLGAVLTWGPCTFSSLGRAIYKQRSQARSSQKLLLVDGLVSGS